MQGKRESGEERKGGRKGGKKREGERGGGGGRKGNCTPSSSNFSGALTVLGLDGGAAHSNAACWEADKLSTKNKYNDVNRGRQVAVTRCRISCLVLAAGGAPPRPLPCPEQSRTDRQPNGAYQHKEEEEEEFKGNKKGSGVRLRDPAVTNTPGYKVSGLVERHGGAAWWSGMVRCVAVALGFDASILATQGSTAGPDLPGTCARTHLIWQSPLCVGALRSRI